MAANKFADKHNFSEKEIEDFRHAFEFFDKNGDGNITSKEFESILRGLGHSHDEQNIKQMMSKYDGDGNSCIDFPEFVEFMASKKRSFGENESSIRNAFRVLDKDCNGYITPRELREWVYKLGEKLTQKEANDLVKEADANGDGKISIDEFVALMVND